MTHVPPLQALRSARAVSLLPARRPSVALVGGGPTTLYALQVLSEHDVPFDIHVFEKDGHVGPGMPYREGINHPQMLANIGGRELPPLLEPLHDWLARCDAEALQAMGIDRAEIGPDAFYPRVVLGRYFTAQLAGLVARARSKGHAVTLRARHRVLDIRPERQIEIDWESPSGRDSATFDHVVLATGHHWRSDVTDLGIRMQRPWPVEDLRRFIGESVAILGTSLTAIDAAVALAGLHGRFVEDGSAARWEMDGPAEGFHLTMMSRKGLLPPADWYYTLPLPELANLTGKAAQRAIAAGADGLLDRCHELLVRDRASIDSALAKRLQLFCLDGLAERFFTDRMALDTWEATRLDLEIAEADRRLHTADPWRMALLRAHEVLEEVIPHMTEADRERLNRELTPIFTDCYASVPHRSVRRMMALHEAGVLDVVRLNADYQMADDGRGVEITHASGKLQVAGVVDARGQQSADLVSLFPGLAAQESGLSFDPVSCAVTLPEDCQGTLTCVSIPVLLPTDPFVQGLERARDLGHMAARRIVASA